MASGSLPNGIHTYYWDWPAANTVAEIGIPAPGAGNVIVLDEILFGYNLTPIAATELAVALDGNDTIKIPVTDPGAHRYPGTRLIGADGSAVKITLPADSGGAKGYLNVQARSVPIGHIGLL